MTDTFSRKCAQSGTGLVLCVGGVVLSVRALGIYLILVIDQTMRVVKHEHIDLDNHFDHLENGKNKKKYLDGLAELARSHPSRVGFALPPGQKYCIWIGVDCKGRLLYIYDGGAARPESVVSLFPLLHETTYLRGVSETNQRRL